MQWELNKNWILRYRGHCLRTDPKLNFPLTGKRIIENRESFKNSDSTAHKVSRLYGKSSAGFVIIWIQYFSEETSEQFLKYQDSNYRWFVYIQNSTVHATLFINGSIANIV